MRKGDLRGYKVRDKCRAYAIEADAEHGIRGRLNRVEWVRLRRAWQDAAAEQPGDAAA